MAEAASLDAIVRYRPLDEHLATAGQPTEAQLAAVAAAGFDVVVNLALHDDARYSLPDEPGTVAALGLRYVHIPVPFAAPRAEHLAAFSTAMAAAAGRRVFVHCAHNKRVPVFIALDRIRRLGWDEETALQAMREVWEPDATWQRFIDAQLAR